MAARVRKDDMVMVVAGVHKGARGKVLRVLRDKDRVVVEGVNMVYRHVRRTQRNPQGGRVQKEAAIHISNVMPIDPRTDKPTRVRFEQTPHGKRRIAAGSGAPLSEITHATKGGK